jgi:hypothetical protein
VILPIAVNQPRTPILAHLDVRPEVGKKFASGAIGRFLFKVGARSAIRPKDTTDGDVAETQEVALVRRGRACLGVPVDDVDRVPETLIRAITKVVALVPFGKRVADLKVRVHPIAPVSRDVIPVALVRMNVDATLPAWLIRVTKLRVLNREGVELAHPGSLLIRAKMRAGSAALRPLAIAQMRWALAPCSHV